MTREGSDAKMFPPPADLLAEHDVHQLRVSVGRLQSCARAVGFIVDVVKANLAPLGKHGRDIDHPSIAGCREFFPQKVGQQKVGEVVRLHDQVECKQGRLGTWVRFDK